MIFKKTKKVKIKYINAVKIEQMLQIFLNACVYAKQKINLTWPKGVLLNASHISYI